METPTFYEYLESHYNAKKTGTVSSYKKALKIIDELFLKNDKFQLKGSPLHELKDPGLIAQIVEFIDYEEDRYRINKKESFFAAGKSNQTSYPFKRYCTGAIHKLRDYVNEITEKESLGLMTKYPNKGEKISKELLEKFNFNKEKTEVEAMVKRRVGQDIFRTMLLKIYDCKCCLTGLDVPETLRASHIVAWSDDEKNRLNPENGLCLSATYDAAFDKHLISFDEDYRMILSNELKDHYTSESFKTHFLEYEGKAIQMPSMFLPSQTFLKKHRDKLIS